MRRPVCQSSLYLLAGLALALPFVAAGPLLEPGELAELAAPSDPVGPADRCEDAAIDPALVGVWQRWEAVTEGDRLRFYFFHERGFGLYRYGKIGLTNTHSFDYSADGDTLELYFRKTGERHRIPYRLEQKDGRTWLVLDDDPREAGGARYFKADDAAGACPPDPVPTATDPIGGRLWGDEVRYATGGMGFSIYQFQAQAIDGRSVGWHHRGDYDEWTTETLTFRQRGDRLALSFPLRHDGGETAITLTGSGPDRRLHLADDPRDFWRPHTYRDMGPTFAAAGSGANSRIASGANSSTDPSAISPILPHTASDALRRARGPLDPALRCLPR